MGILSDYIVKLDSVSLAYSKNRTILDNVSVGFKKGNVSAIIGESGVGKSTLLKLINGSLSKEDVYKYEGCISIDGKSVFDEKSDKRKVGTVYQNPDNQIVFTNVEDELIFGMENYAMSKEEMDSRLDSVTTELNMKHLLERNPHELSGGEKQLVILGAILCLDIEILILDECMAQIDMDGKKLIKDTIKKLKSEGKTIIMVEHEHENLDIVDDIFVLKDMKLQKCDR